MFGYGYYNSSQRPQETLVNKTQSVAKENTQTATAAQKQKEEPTIDSTKILPLMLLKETASSAKSRSTSPSRIKTSLSALTASAE